MIEKILNSQTKSISLASFILATSYFLSALLGLFRDRLLAGTFGASHELDIYYTAFTLPDLLGLIIIFGAISSAVIPIFSSYLLKSKKEAWDYLSNFLNIFLGFLILVCLVSFFCTSFFVSIISPGFSQQKKEVTARLMQIMMLSPIILGLSNTISAVLQVFQRFLATAIAPLLYNIGIITGILLFYPFFGLQGLALGVVLGAVMHLLIQLPVFFYSGFSYKPSFKLNHPGVIKTFKLMIPRSLGLAAGQLNIMVIIAIASTLSAGSIAVFNLANNLSSILVNIFALSLSVAVFPSFSMAFLQAEEEKLAHKFSYSFRQILFIAIPISVLIIILRAQIVRVILGAGRFGWVDTRLTAAALGILAFSLFAQGLIPLLSRTFYAFCNTFIPALISILTVIFNIILSFSLVWSIKSFPHFSFFLKILFRLENIKDIGIIGLILAFSFTTIFQAFLLMILLFYKYRFLRIKNFFDSLLKILVATSFMALGVIVLKTIIGYIFNLQTFWEVFLQLIISSIVGIAIFILISVFLKSPELKIIFDSFLKKILSLSDD